MLRKLFWLMVVIVLLLSGAGCGKKTPDVGKTGSERASFPVTVQDDLGRPVTVEKPPARIVSLAPSNTEILFALGLGSKVVGVTTYCDYPKAVKKKPKIGGFADPSLEKILAQEPDLVLATEKHQSIVQALEKEGIDVLVLAPRKVAAVLEDIKLVGRATGTTKAAATLVTKLQQRIEAVTAKVQQIPVSRRPKVFYELWYEPLITAGPGTFIDDLIRLAGGVNVAADAGKEYPEYSLETLLEKDPDVLITSYGHGPGMPTKEAIKRRKGWEALKCVRHNRIYTVDADLVNRPGPRIVDALEAFARAIHPELFK